MQEGPRRGISRREFVRNAVGGAALGGAASLGLLSYYESRSARLGDEYVGAELLGGPAYSGLPLLPVRRLADGVLEGAASESQLGTLRYCSRQAARGLQADYDGDDVLRYDEHPEILRLAERQGVDLWYKDLLGQPARAEHFSQYGMGAPVRWRSDGEVDQNVVRLLLFRVHSSTYPASVQTEFAPNEFVALSAACTHFCCVAGYRRSRAAEQRGLWDYVYCDCHGAYWDPFDVRRYDMPPSGRPSDGPRQAGRPIHG